MIIQSDSEHAHGSHSRRMRTTDIRDTRTSPVISKGSNGEAERAVQSVEGMARTPRLDLLGRTNIAVSHTGW